MSEKLRDELTKLIEVRRNFVTKRKAMNTAIPDPMTATPAERALYDERYRADHEAERELFSAALNFATWAETREAVGLLLPSPPAPADMVERVARALMAYRGCPVPEGSAIADVQFGRIALGDAEAMLAAIDLGRAGEGWRPIESAPKDGTWFIAYQNEEQYPCQWECDEADEGPLSEGWFDLFNRSFEEPVYWRPLSAPPALTKEL